MHNKTEKSILYLDDQIENLTLFTLFFSEKYNIMCSNDPFDAIEIIKKNNIHIMISDYMMPKMNGVEFLEILKNEFPHIKRIMLTSSSDSNLESFAREKCDLYAFLTKPFNKSIIEKTIDDALNNKVKTQ